MTLFAAIIFISAALLFMLQPMAAKLLLPYFGGGAAVWTACMLFFQVFLLLGYGYAYLVSRFATPLWQRGLHGLLLALSLLCLPQFWQAVVAVPSAELPLLTILGWLTLTVGLPYLLLSATSPLLQHWFAWRFAHRSPFRLYALSNIGSLGGLLSYPFLIDAWLPLPQQRQWWLLLYLLFCAACLVLCFKLKDLPDNTRAEPLKLTDSRWPRWLAFSAFGVVLLLAITQQLTQNVPPVPFLWVLPLALYLLSYVVVFNRSSWYQRSFWLYLFSLSLIFCLLLFYFGRQFDLVSQVVLYLVILFSGTMLCHGEIAHSKPEAKQLTAFYLLLAAGGVLGGLAVNIIAPLCFNNYWELPLVLLAIYGLVMTLQWRRFNGWQLTGCAATALLFSAGFMFMQSALSSGDVQRQRNFYGTLVVRDINLAGELQRLLIDGTTSHGAQYLAADKAKTPLSYYRPATGVAIALNAFRPADTSTATAPKAQRHFGFVGLGTGALAAYGRAGDRIQFYEINPAVIGVAQQYFSYIADSAAEVSIVLGDARLSLASQFEQQGSQQFDVLVLDAFSSDSIPQHLLTEQAMTLYWQHLRYDGVLAVHVSNNYLDLTSLLRNQAATQGLNAYFIATAADADNPAATEWVLLSRNESFAQQAQVQQALSPWPRPLTALRWTDQRSSLLQVLK